VALRTPEEKIENPVGKFPKIWISAKTPGWKEFGLL
jgi:hypothetical protein